MASNINPSNIDGDYPVADIDNDSQGFRDNFGNTSTNFTFAVSEIEDLQAKAILKAPLDGESVTDNVLTTLLTIAVSAPATAGLNIAEGVAPTVPNDGDVWVTAAGAFNARLNGVTVDLSGPSSSTVTKFAQDNTTAVAAEQFTHSLGTTDVIVQVYDLTTTPATLQIPTSVEIDDANNVTITLAVAPGIGDYRVVITG